MVPQIPARFSTVKALVRVALVLLGLHGFATAHPATRETPQPSGNNYNFMAGGGG